MKLTQTVKKGGCAAKVPAMILREILAGLKFPPTIPGVIVDGSHFDDAAIYQISDDISLVQTLDFFTPIVDTPYEFGAIAAANALSDVYAMGGKPKTCMAILAAPLAILEPAIIQEVLQGASDVMARSGSSLVGGHSIDDDTLKFGLSVTGVVHPSRTWTNQGARPGDILILTKPIGTGTICATLKKQEITQEQAHEAISSMQRLNNVVDFIDPGLVHGATDITGFGLAGHSVQLAKASDVTLKINFASLPRFELTMKCLEQGNLTKAHRSNDEYTRGRIHFSQQTDLDKLVFFDPQTSGGLLLSVSPEDAENIVKNLRLHFPGTSIIGQVLERGEVDVQVE